MELATDFFSLFALTRNFKLDQQSLDEAYRAMQSQVHPDRFVSASAQAQRISMQKAALANEAYATLKSPLKRAAYLLALHGHDLAAESNTAMPTDFLMAQMAWREQVAEARAAQAQELLESLATKLAQEMAADYAQLAILLDVEQDYPAAAALTRRLMFLDKLHHDIDDALAEFD